MFPDAQLWATLNDNFLDIAVLDWCKLFREEKGVHSWRRAVAEPEHFQDYLLNNLSVSPQAWGEYIKEHRTYRDKFLAHLDELPTMHIPDLTWALASVSLLHSTLRKEDHCSRLERLGFDLEEALSTYSAEGDALYKLAQAQP